MPTLASLKLYLYGALLLAVVAGAWWLHHHIDAGGYNRAKAEDAKAVVDRLIANQAKEARDRAALATRVKSYEDRIRELQADAAARPAPVVRLCVHSGGAGPLPASPAVAGEPDRGPSTGLGAADGSDYREGPDIGADLTRYALDCQAQAIQLDEVLKAESAVGSAAPPIPAPPP